MSKFKILKEHQEIIKSEVDKVFAKYPNIIVEYQNGNFARSHLVKDIQKRFCFDILFGTGLNSWLCDNIYTYANGDHLYSFLKSICPKIERNY